MKIAVIIIRVLMGLMFLMASVTWFFIVPPEVTGDMKIFSDGLKISVYIMPVVKCLELILAVSLLTNRFVPLAVVVLFPINVNITLTHLFLDPKGLAIALPLLLGNLFLAWYYRDLYKPLFKAKP